MAKKSNDTLYPVLNEQSLVEEKPKLEGMKRYNLVIPENLFNEVQKLANQEHTTVVDLFRRFIKFGLIAAQIAQKPDGAVIIREGGRDREVLFLT